MQFACQQKSLRTISEQYGTESKRFLDMMDPDDDNKQQSIFYDNFYQYESVDDIAERLNDGWPLCEFNNHCVNNSVCVVYGKIRSMVVYVRLDIDRNRTVLTCGEVNYFPVEINACSGKPFHKQQFNVIYHGYCLILPHILIDETIPFSKRYTLVTDDWKDFADGDYNFSSHSPKISGKSFKGFLNLS